MHFELHHQWCKNAVTSVSREWKFFSRNIASNTQTSLQGVEWTPEKWLKAAVPPDNGSLAVAPDEFLSTAVYEVVTAPAQARADADDVAAQTEIVVRHKPLTR